jgi:hypothetical protein
VPSYPTIGLGLCLAGSLPSLPLGTTRTFGWLHVPLCQDATGSALLITPGLVDLTLTAFLVTVDPPHH